MASETVLDIRSLPGTRETLAYQDGGLFPVLALTADRVAVAALRGGAGHIGREGRMETVRSLDGGLSWTPPNLIADSEDDDRNPAMAYHPAAHSSSSTTASTTTTPTATTGAAPR